MARIFIVDDSIAIRSHARQALEVDGHQVFEAENGNDGLNKIVAMGNPDLVISDYNMPGVDGLTMLKGIKEKLGAGKFPIFMLTTETSDQLKTLGKQLGVVVWINKPLVPDTLRSLVKKVLAAKKPAA